MSRLEKVKKNVAVSCLSQIITMIMAFACRTVFIQQLDAVYLGINGLFTNILGILSLAELGFGTAMNFEMYKPVAENDYAKIGALLKLYKKVYHGVAAFIVLGGLAVVPFLPSLVRDSGSIGNIYVYYVLYILNTVIGYYSSYLLCLPNAEQNEYISSLFIMAQTLLANVLEIIVLIAFKSFYLYLLVWLLSTSVQQIVIRIYFKKNYGEVLYKESGSLDFETKSHIKKNMGGLIVGKFAEVLLLQTDNIIIALGLNIVTVGYADNYYLIVNYLKKIMLSFLKSAVPSLGNMVATESKEKGYEIFKLYDFIDYLIYSIIFICLVVLFQPFISLWAGSDRIIDYRAMLLLCLSFYISGRMHSFSNYKTAYGIFYDTKITSVVTVLLNIIISIVGVYKIGLMGIYLGTCISNLYSNVRTLWLAYEKITGKSVSWYYIKRIYQAMLTIVPIVLLNHLAVYFRPTYSWIIFFVFSLGVVGIAFIWISLVYWRSKEYKDLRVILRNEIRKVRKRMA